MGRWCDKQRHHYKKHIEGKPSPLTAPRVKALQELDFVWFDVDLKLKEHRIAQMLIPRVTYSNLQRENTALKRKAAFNDSAAENLKQTMADVKKLTAEVDVLKKNLSNFEALLGDKKVNDNSSENESTGGKTSTEVKAEVEPTKDVLQDSPLNGDQNETFGGYKGTEDKPRDNIKEDLRTQNIT